MKKGFTIIEVIISIALIGMLLCVEIPAASKYIKVFNESILESRDTFYVNQAFDFIESMVGEAKCAGVKNNVIELVRQDGKGSDWIMKDNSGDLIISYYYCYYGTTNNIMKNMGSFEAVKSGKTILVSITTKKGKTYRKCIFINVEKAKKDLYWCTLL